MKFRFHLQNSGILSCQHRQSWLPFTSPATLSCKHESLRLHPSLPKEQNLVPVPVADIPAPPRCVCVCGCVQNLSYLFRHFPWEEEVGQGRQGHQAGGHQEPEPPGPDPARVLVGELHLGCNTSGERGIRPTLGQGREPRAPKGGPSDPQHQSAPRWRLPTQGPSVLGCEQRLPSIIPSLNHISLSLSYFTAVPRVSKEPLSPLDGDSWDRDVPDARSAPLAQGTEPTGGWKPLCFRSSHRTRSLTCADFVDVHVEPQHGRAQHEGHPRPDDRHGEQDSCGGTRAGKGSAWGKGSRGKRG